ncbi:MAG: S-layer homology domain-containing protein [Synergistaceae bacterium]
MKKLVFIVAVIAVLVLSSTAFAANPFADVPQGHWSYDAVSQLKSQGIVAETKDENFKGDRLATRYEIAAIVARALAKIDVNKVSKENLEIIKKLVLEYNDELTSLGVKSDKVDSRIAVFEENLSGWQISGTFRFDAVFGTDKQRFLNEGAYGKTNTQFRKEHFYLYFTKQIDENTSFFGEYLNGADDADDVNGGMGDMSKSVWREVNVTTLLPYDIKFKFGRFLTDFEDEYGLYNDDVPMFGYFFLDGFKFSKSFGNLTMTGIVGRNPKGSYNESEEDELGFDASNEHMNYVFNMHYEPNESLFAGLLGYLRVGDASSSADDLNYRLGTFGLYGGYKITEGITAKALFYRQNIDSGVAEANGWNDSATALKYILEIDQELLKFTSLWIEYNEQDNNFLGIRIERFGIGGSSWNYAVSGNKPYNNNRGKYLYIKAEQEWSEKFSTRLRYTHVDYDTENYDNANEYGAAIIYRYTPAIAFELMYHYVDFGNTTEPEAWRDSDHVVIFRSIVNF